MMNFPGVISADSPTVAKIIASQAHHKKIDGHAPGLSGTDLNAYIAAGVYSDHECADIDDAMKKLKLGQFIMIREGTRRPESGGSDAPDQVPEIFQPLHVLHRRQAPQRSAGKGSHRLHLPGSCRHGCRPHHDRAGGLSPRRPVLPAE